MTVSKESEPRIPDPPTPSPVLRVRYFLHIRSARFRGHLWMIRRYGVRRWWRYEQGRRAGLTINYMDVFTPEEIQTLIDECLLPPRADA